MNNRRMAVVLGSVLVTQACLISPSRAQSGDAERMCNPWIIGATAGVACALLSSGSRRVLTGAACTAVAVIGCYMLNSYKAQQVRTGDQVEEEYKRANADLPERATLTEYTSEIDPATASRGQKVSVGSRIKVVRGRNEETVNVEEEIGLFDAKGDPWGKPVRKPANTGGQSGEYQTSFTIPIHQGMSQGVYQIRKTLYLNGAAVSSDDQSKFQVVWTASGPVFGMADTQATAQR
jgi:hypothetical protein